jgi:hypothetical protein
MPDSNRLVCSQLSLQPLSLNHINALKKITQRQRLSSFVEFLYRLRDPLITLILFLLLMKPRRRLLQSIFCGFSAYFLVFSLRCLPSSPSNGFMSTISGLRILPVKIHYFYAAFVALDLMIGVSQELSLPFLYSYNLRSSCLSLAYPFIFGS